MPDSPPPRRPVQSRTIPLAAVSTADDRDPRSKRPSRHLRPLHELKLIHYPSKQPRPALLAEAGSVLRVNLRTGTRSNSKNFLFISNLNDNVTASFLKKKISQEFPVRNIRVPERDGRRIGIASVQIPSASDPSEYVEKFHGTPLCGYLLCVEPDYQARRFDREYRRATYPNPFRQQPTKPRLAQTAAPGSSRGLSNASPVRHTQPTHPRGLASHGIYRSPEKSPRSRSSPGRPSCVVTRRFREVGHLATNTSSRSLQRRFAPKRPGILVRGSPASMESSRLLRLFAGYRPKAASRLRCFKWIVSFSDVEDRDDALRELSPMIDSVELDLLPVDCSSFMDSQSRLANELSGKRAGTLDREGTDAASHSKRGEDYRVMPREGASEVPKDGLKLARQCSERVMVAEEAGHKEKLVKPSVRERDDSSVKEKAELAKAQSIRREPGLKEAEETRGHTPSGALERPPTGFISIAEACSDDQVCVDTFEKAMDALISHFVTRSLLRHRGTLTKSFEAHLKERAKHDRSRIGSCEVLTGVPRTNAALAAVPPDCRNEGNHVDDGVSKIINRSHEPPRDGNARGLPPMVTPAHSDLDAYLRNSADNDGQTARDLNGPRRKRFRTRDIGELSKKQRTEFGTERKTIELPIDTSLSSMPQDTEPKLEDISAEKVGTVRVEHSCPSSAEPSQNEQLVVGPELSGNVENVIDGFATPRQESDAETESGSDDHILIPPPDHIAVKECGRIPRGKRRSRDQNRTIHKRKTEEVDVVSSEAADAIPTPCQKSALPCDDANYSASDVPATKRRKLEDVGDAPKNVERESRSNQQTNDVKVNVVEEPKIIDSRKGNRSCGTRMGSAASARTAGLRLCDWRRGKEEQNPRKFTQQTIDVLYSSRDNRQRNRMFRKGISLINPKHDVLTVNQLKQRKKAVQFRKSTIHGMGLFACETIESGEFIIEYIGQIVRSVVADIREELHGRRGIGDSYLFRLPNGQVVDATQQGGIARFINHSCNPNVIAKIIMVDGESKIVFYSKRRIVIDDELTYDYKFDFEEDEKKIKCLCAAPNCRKFLN